MSSPDPEPEALLMRMIGLWQEVLGQEDIVAGSDFFRLGGDSLAATTMVEAIETEFGVALDPIDIFEWSGLTALTRLVQTQLAEIEEGVL